MLADLILENRSCRRFYQDEPIPGGKLEALVDLARLSASAANLQPLRFILSRNPEINSQIFSCLGWAGYLTEWPGPEDGERPGAYILILGDSSISRYCDIDCGIAAQSILLGAREMGFAGCMIANINRKKLRSRLGIQPQFKILLVLAMGKPKETVVIEPMGTDGNVQYWREGGIHHVPKRSLCDIIINSYGTETEGELAFRA